MFGVSKGTSEQSRHPGWIPDSLTLTPLFPFVLSVAKRSRRTRSCPLPDCSEVPEVASGFRVGKAGGKGDRQGTDRHFTASAGPASAPSGSAPRCAVVPPLPRGPPRQAVSREAGSADAHLRHSADAPPPVIPQTPILHHSCGCPPSSFPQTSHTRHSRESGNPSGFIALVVQISSSRITLLGPLRLPCPIPFPDCPFLSGPKCRAPVGLLARMETRGVCT